VFGLYNPYVELEGTLESIGAGPGGSGRQIVTKIVGKASLVGVVTGVFPEASWKCTRVDTHVEFNGVANIQLVITLSESLAGTTV